MKKYFQILFLIFICAFLLSTCKKYPEDDSKIHLSTVKNRLAGNFINKNKTWDAGPQPYNFVANTYLSISASDNIIFYRSGAFHGNHFPYLRFDGTWKFIDKKDKIEIANSSGGTVLEFTVKKLDSDVLWLQNDSIIFKYEKHINR